MSDTAGPSMEETSMVTFTAGFLEFLCMLAGTTEIRAGPSFGIYLIRVGDHRFEGETTEEAYRKLLRWMLDMEVSETRQFYEEQAVPVEEGERRDEAALIDELTKDGMTDFGQAVEGGRQERKQTLLEELKRLREESPSSLENVDQLLPIVIRNTNLVDLDVRELLESLVIITKEDKT